MVKHQRLRQRIIMACAIAGLAAALYWPEPRTAAASAASHPSIAGLTGDNLFARLIEANQRREAQLHKYSVPRTYQVKSASGKVRAESNVVLQYRAPQTKEFRVVAEKGSGIVRSRVFKPLMESEQQTAAGRNKHDSSITPQNYTFKLLGEEDVDGYHCFAVEAIPKRNDTYLFKGKLWIHATDFAIVRITGQPAKSPSFWIKRVDFVRRYQKVGNFWLPLKDESTSQVRIFGTQILTIDYGRYEIS